MFKIDGCRFCRRNTLIQTAFFCLLMALKCLSCNSKTNKIKNFMTKKFLFISNFLFFFFLCFLSPAFTQSEQASPFIKKAKDHLNLFQYDQANALLKQAIQADPQNWEPYFLLGRSLLRQKNEIEAEKYLSRAHSLKPDELDCQKALGAIYISFAKNAQTNGKQEEMVEYLHKACKAYPGGTKIWVSLLEAWWKSNLFDKIIQEGDFILAQNKRLLDQAEDKGLQQSLLIVAKAHYHKGDFPSTEKFLDAAGKIRQPNDELYSLKREIKAKAEENARSLVNQAQKEADSGNYDKALTILEQAGKTSKAAEIQEMIDKITNEAGVQKVLNEANNLRKAEKHEAALERLEEASLQFPEDERIANLMAVVNQTVEKINADKAEKNARLIAEKKERLEKAQQYQFFVKEGQSNERQQNFEVAIINFEKALAVKPESEQLKKKIEELKTAAEKFKERQVTFNNARADLLAMADSNRNEEAYTKGKEIIEEFEENKKDIALILAEVCLKLEKLEEAKEFALLFEENENEKNLYNYVLGMVAFKQGNRSTALEYLKKVEKNTANFRPDISSTIWSIYFYQYQAGIYIVLLILLFPISKAAKEAFANFRQNSMLRKIERIRESGAYEANIDFLEERFAREDAPNPKQVAVMLAEALLRKGSPQRCYEIINNLLKRDAKNPHARRLAGEACLALEDSSPTGLDHVQNLYKIDESRKDVVEFLAKTYIRQQADHKLAQDFIGKYIALNPSDSDALAFLADTIIKRQSYSQQSAKILERMIKLAPEVPDYYSALITNYRKIDNHDEARKLREIAQSKFPNDPEFSDTAPVSGPAKVALRSSSATGFPDYDNIGNEQPSMPSSTGGFPNYESIGNEPTQPVQANPGSGPSKVCPHCQAANPVKEYYCTTCGRPL